MCVVMEGGSRDRDRDLDDWDIDIIVVVFYCCCGIVIDDCMSLLCMIHNTISCYLDRV